MLLSALSISLSFIRSRTFFAPKTVNVSTDLRRQLVLFAYAAIYDGGDAITHNFSAARVSPHVAIDETIEVWMALKGF
jgi:hypothetical protein